MPRSVGPGGGSVGRVRLGPGPVGARVGRRRGGRAAEAREDGQGSWVWGQGEVGQAAWSAERAARGVGTWGEIGGGARGAGAEGPETDLAGARLRMAGYQEGAARGRGVGSGRRSSLKPKDRRREPARTASDAGGLLVAVDLRLPLSVDRFRSLRGSRSLFTPCRASGGPRKAWPSRLPHFRVPW